MIKRVKKYLHYFLIENPLHVWGMILIVLIAFSFQNEGLNSAKAQNCTSFKPAFTPFAATTAGSGTHTLDLGVHDACGLLEVGEPIEADSKQECSLSMPSGNNWTLTWSTGGSHPAPICAGICMDW